MVNLTSRRDLVRLKRAESSSKLTRADYLVVNPSFLFRNGRGPRHFREACEHREADAECLRVQLQRDVRQGCVLAQSRHHNRADRRFPNSDSGAQGSRAGTGARRRRQAIERPRSLWFITHGFFCENAPGAGGAESLGERAVAPSGRADDDPMARGALVLAGAQVGGTGDGEDGFLQGSEIVERDWEGTDLVVLGACETALGVPSVGDGVYGMRRALALAGVRSQVMTLWRVSQAQTFELLQDFANLLKQGKGKAAALAKRAQDSQQIPASLLLGWILLFRGPGPTQQ